MRKILKRRVYDTNTAKCIAINRNDFTLGAVTPCFYSKIYHKRNGELFEYYYHQIEKLNEDGSVFRTEETYRHITPLDAEGITEWLEICEKNCDQLEGFDVLKLYAAQSKPEINELNICD